MWNLLDPSDRTMIVCRVLAKHNKLFSYVRMNIDIENCPSDVCSFVYHTENGTGH